MRARVLLAFALLGAGTVSPGAALSGRYSERFPNALVTGEKYTSENIVEIVPVGPRAAYVRIETEWYNGHSCSLWGIAQAEGDRLVYRDRYSEQEPCVLSMRRMGNKLRMQDEPAGSCQRYCGARGSFNGVDLPFTSRRPITYLKRLRASSEFREAIKEWRAH